MHWEDYSDMKDSWVKKNDIDAKMIRVYFERLKKKESENKTYKMGI